MTSIQKKLFSLQDEDYRLFHSRLMPTVNFQKIIGVRIPQLRAFAKELCGTKEAEKFLKALPHQYYEENNLHAFLIEKINDFDECVSSLEKFLPFVDNWATCDSMKPAALGKNLPELEKQLRLWLKSKDVYTVRFAVVTAMKFFLGKNYKSLFPKLLAEINSDEYYINMAIAWFFATALGKNYEEVLPFLKNNNLPLWTHNKTIQKARESLLLTKEQKAFLTTLKR